MFSRSGRASLAVLLGLVLFVGACVQAAEDTVEARLRRDITFLASDQCEGRGITTQGINVAADYIAQEFKKAGLKPGGPNSSYFQPFTIAGNTLLPPTRLALRGPRGQEIELTIGRHYRPMGLSGSGKLTAPVIFVGYGASTSKTSGQDAAGSEFGYDDYAGVDVAGKVVVILRDTPRADNKFASFDGSRRRTHGALTQKITQAEKHKTAAAVFVNDRDTAKGDDQLLHFEYLAALRAPGKMPVLQVRRAVLDEMLESSVGTSLAEIEEDIDRDLKPRPASLKGWTMSLEVHTKRGDFPVKNVVGVLEGAGPLAKQTIVVGAHYDHLGYGGNGSLAALKKEAIHHGADDNGSGTTSLLEVARYFAQQPARQGRRLVFIAFSGEESGLLGSLHYCKSPLVPLSETAAMVNMDMVGRLPLDKDRKDSLTVYGIGTAKSFEALVDRYNGKYHFRLNKVRGASMLFGASDHFSFYLKQIPVLFFFTGDHPDYHRPSDTSDKINIAGMRRIVGLVEDVTSELTLAPEKPPFVKLSSGASRAGSGSIPRLSIRFDYGDVGEGALIQDVTEGGPGDKGGLKPGDRIVALAGKDVKNLDAYMVLMAEQKKGQPLEVGILRGGKKMTLKVTPE